MPIRITWKGPRKPLIFAARIPTAGAKATAHRHPGRTLAVAGDFAFASRRGSPFSLLRPFRPAPIRSAAEFGLFVNHSKVWPGIRIERRAVFGAPVLITGDSPG